MAIEDFREQCKKSKFYYFKSLKDFDKRIDWDGRFVKHIRFERGVIDEGIDNIPTRYSAYGTRI